MSQTNAWMWSEEFKRYYRSKGHDSQGNVQYEWEEPSSASTSSDIQHTAQTSASSQQQIEEIAPFRNRADSHLIDPNMVPAASDQVRPSLSFTGTPERGWYDPLDASYRMRTKGEAHRFFQKGRVLAMLWAEACSETASRFYKNGTENTAITVGRFGEKVFSQIRRFVVVKVNRPEHFIYAIAITTYGSQGVTKPGCNAQDHSIVYLKGQQPVQFTGEAERGLIKDPIMIEPSDENEEMNRGSRLRYSKIYAIEWNVKVRDIGMVSKNHRAKLMKYFRESQASGFDSDTDEEAGLPSSHPAALEDSNYYLQNGSSPSHRRRQSDQPRSHPQHQYTQQGPSYPHQTYSQPQPQYHQAPYPAYPPRYPPGYGSYQ